jgi:hypothetical protein
MKSTILALLLLVAGSTMSLAQCDKKVVLHASKSEQLDGSGAVQGTKDEQTTLEIDKTGVTVSISGNEGDQKLTGAIKSNTCNWKVPFKEGKTVITTTLKDDSGNDPKDFTITIEGKEGKVTLIAESPSMPDRKIKLYIEKFEEKN